MKKILLLTFSIISFSNAWGQQIYPEPLEYYLDRTGNPYAMDYDTIWVDNGNPVSPFVREEYSLNFYQQVYLSQATVRQGSFKFGFVGGVSGGDFLIHKTNLTTGDTMATHTFYKDVNGNDSLYEGIDLTGPAPEQETEAKFYYATTGRLDSMDVKTEAQGMPVNLRQVFFYSGPDLDSIEVADLDANSFSVTFRYYKSVVRDSMLAWLTIPGSGSFITVKEVYGHNALGEINEVKQYETQNPGPLPLIAVAHYGKKAQVIGIEEESLSRINLYPNPVQEMLFIDAEYDQEIFVELADLNGKSMMIINAIGPTDLNMSDISKGVYLLSITSGRQRQISRVVKQ